MSSLLSRARAGVITPQSQSWTSSASTGRKIPGRSAATPHRPAVIPRWHVLAIQNRAVVVCTVSINYLLIFIGVHTSIKPNQGHLWFWQVMGLPTTHSLDNLYPFGSICFVLLLRFLMSHWKTHQEIFERSAILWESTWFNIWILNINKMRYPWGTHQHTSTNGIRMYSLYLPRFFFAKIWSTIQGPASQQQHIKYNAPWIWQPRLLFFFFGTSRKP